MDSLKMKMAFIREISQYINAPDFNETDIFYWLNEAVEKFIETRLSGNNLKGESLEETQKRLDDLRTLIVSEETINGVDLTSGTSKPNSYIADLTSLSSTYRHRVGEEVTIQYTDALGVSQTKRQGVTECNADRYRAKIDDPFSEHRLHYGEAKPLRLFVGSDVELITDGDYTITAYYISYLKDPVTISNTQNCDLAAHTHREIVKLAVNLALENIGNQRYQTNSVEIQNME